MQICYIYEHARRKYPRRYRLGLIEAAEAGHRAEVSAQDIRGVIASASLKPAADSRFAIIAKANIRGVIASASLKLPGGRRAGRVGAAYPRRYRLGLIEAQS